MAESKVALPPYLDSSHEYYSEFLDIAINAWMAQYVDGGFKERSSGHKPQIKNWLMNHHSKSVKSDSARECIATVVSPDKIGGNPLLKKG